MNKSLFFGLVLSSLILAAFLANFVWLQNSSVFAATTCQVYQDGQISPGVNPEGSCQVDVKYFDKPIGTVDVDNAGLARCGWEIWSGTYNGAGACAAPDCTTSPVTCSASGTTVSIPVTIGPTGTCNDAGAPGCKVWAWAEDAASPANKYNAYFNLDTTGNHPPTCTALSASAGAPPACNNNGVCDAGENYSNCPSDCPAPPAQFVRIEGGQFKVGANSFKHIGVDSAQLPWYGTSCMNSTFASEVDVQLQAAKDMGVKVVRVFGSLASFSNPDAINRLTQLADKAYNNYGIRLLVSLINYFGGDSCSNAPQGATGFYQVDRNGFRVLNPDFFTSGFRGVYLDWVRAVVTALKNHPGIFAWELGNEIKNVTFANSDPASLVGFVQETAQAIRAIDTNHLITVGFEGFEKTGMTSTDFIQLNQYLDFIQVHRYGSDSRDARDDSWAAPSKPMIIGEAGFEGTNRGPLVQEDLNWWFSRNSQIQGYYQWGFLAVNRDNGDGDTLFGMDHLWHGADWDALFNIYKTKAQSLSFVSSFHFGFLDNFIAGIKKNMEALAATVFNIVTPSTVYFTASGADQDAGDTIAKYQWDFNGDGTWDTTEMSSNSTSYTYSTPGNYCAKVRVKDSQGNWSSNTGDCVGANSTCAVSIAAGGDDIAPTVGKLYITPTRAEQTYPIRLQQGLSYALKADVSDNNAVTNCEIWMNGVNEGSMTVPPNCKNCTASANMTFNVQATYLDSKARCYDAANNMAEGPSTTVYVDNLWVKLTAIPKTGTPTTKFDLKAEVFGQMPGTINYKFDCGEDGTGDWELQLDTQTQTTYTAVDLCQYPAAGNYVPRVVIERGTGSAGDTDPVSVGANQSPTAGFSCDASACGPGASSANCIGYQGCLLKANNLSTDPNGDADIQSAVWTTKDKATGVVRDTLTCSQSNPLCNYVLPATLSPRVYNVELQVADAAGLTSSANKDVTIRRDIQADFVCSVDNLLWYDCASPNFKIAKGVKVYFHDNLSDTILNSAGLAGKKTIISEGASRIVRKVWKKDGIVFSSCQSALGCANDNPFSRIEGTEIILEIEDDLGRTAQASSVIKIELPPPEWEEIPPL